MQAVQDNGGAITQTSPFRVKSLASRRVSRHAHTATTLTTPSSPTKSPGFLV